MWTVGAALGRAGRGRGLASVASRSSHVEATAQLPAVLQAPRRHASNASAASPPWLWNRGVLNVGASSLATSWSRRTITTATGALIMATADAAARGAGAAGNSAAVSGSRISTSPDVEPLGDFEWDTLLGMQEFACDKYASRPLFGTKQVRTRSAW